MAGGAWKGNSTFETEIVGVSQAPVERWRKTLDAEMIQFVEFIVGTDMAAAGYTREFDDTELTSADALQTLLAEEEQIASWRSDFQDPVRDFGAECFRRQALCLPPGTLSEDVLRQCFLFPEYEAALRASVRDHA